MSSQSRINAYMERHRLGPLFEELMNKVLRDMPEEPMVYLLRAMYKKAGMEIPQGIRYGGVRKSTDYSRSPERPTRSAQVSSSQDAGSREYNRPWATSPTRKMKVRKSEDLSGTAKQKPEWNGDVKTKPSVFDDFWETTGDVGGKEREKTSTSKKSPSKQQIRSSSAWASVGMMEADEVYSSPNYSGPRISQPASKMSDDSLLALEAVKPSLRGERRLESSVPTASSKHIRGPRLDAKKHRQEYAQTLKDIDQNSDDSGVGRDFGRVDDPDAIELLEDAKDLQREGVTNIPKAGYKLSKAMRYRKNEPRVKLSLNAYAYPADSSTNAYGYQNTSLQSSPEQGFSDDEFESVSQVSGPRQPVWKVPNVESDFASHGPSYSKQVPLNSNTQRKNFTERALSRTSPSPFNTRSVTNTAELDTTHKSWTAGDARVSFEEPVSSRPQSSRSIQSESEGSAGWLVPEGTEVASALDWNQRVKGSRRQDPRSY